MASVHSYFHFRDSLWTLGSNEVLESKLESRDHLLIEILRPGEVALYVMLLVHSNVIDDTQDERPELAYFWKVISRNPIVDKSVDGDNNGTKHQVLLFDFALSLSTHWGWGLSSLVLGWGGSWDARNITERVGQVASIWVCLAWSSVRHAWIVVIWSISRLEIISKVPYFLACLMNAFPVLLDEVPNSIKGFFIMLLGSCSSLCVVIGGLEDFIKLI